MSKAYHTFGQCSMDLTTNYIPDIAQVNEAIATKYLAQEYNHIGGAENCQMLTNPQPIHVTERYNIIRCVKLKGTNGRQKTYEIFHVYCIFYSGFMCQTTVIFGTMKDGSLVLNTLASWNCFTCRNLFQNGANDMSEWLTFETAFCKKSSKFCIVRIIWFWSNFASLW